MTYSKGRYWFWQLQKKTKCDESPGQAEHHLFSNDEPEIRAARHPFVPKASALFLLPCSLLAFEGLNALVLHLVHLHVCVKSDILITRLHGPRGGYSNSKWFQESLMGEKNQALFFFFNWICCYWLFCAFGDDVPVILKLFSITEPTKAFLILSFGLCHSFYPKCLSPPSGKFLLSSNKPFVLLSNNIPISLITGSGHSVEL